MINDKSILLVDDEENIRISIGWALEKHGFSVTVAEDGAEACRLLRGQQYSLVVTDLLMAEIDGIGVLKRAKALYPEIGVIILTGYGDVTSAVQALKLGADDYLQKPCDIDELLNKMRHSLEKQDLAVRLRSQNEELKQEIAARKVAEKESQETRANLARLVDERTVELSETVEVLKLTLEALQTREEEVQEKNRELSDMNTALTIMLKRRDKEHSEIRKEIASKAAGMVLPLLKKAQNKATGVTRDYVETAQANLLDILSTQSHDGVLANARLAPRELQIVQYLRQNKTSKEISSLLNLSVRTVESYRDSIRKKIGIKNQKKNLKKFIISLP